MAGNFTTFTTAVNNNTNPSETFVGVGDGTYTFYAINYLVEDFDNDGVDAGGAAITDPEITSYASFAALNASGLCFTPMQFAANVCASSTITNGQVCSDLGENITILQATPGSFESNGYTQTYLLVDPDGLIVAESADGVFSSTALAVGTYDVYALNYNDTDAPTYTVGTTSIAAFITNGEVHTLQSGNTVTGTSATATTNVADDIWESTNPCYMVNAGDRTIEVGPCCEASAGIVPTDPDGCQAILAAGATTADVSVNSFGFNNNTGYNQVYFLSDGTTISQVVEVAGGGTGEATFTALMAGTYTVHVLNYQVSTYSGTAFTAFTMVSEIPADSEVPCIDVAANTMTIEVCPMVCTCDSDATVGTGDAILDVATATVGSYNSETGYAQTYLLVNASDEIIQMSSTANFTGVDAATYSVYALNYSTIPAEDPTTQITLGTTTYAQLTALAEPPYCYDVQGPQAVTVNACLSVSVDDVCADVIDNLGDLTATAVDGTSPYTYLWSDGSAQTSMLATDLAVGTYTVTVTDSEGCSITAIGEVLTNTPTTSALAGVSVCSDGTGTATTEVLDLSTIETNEGLSGGSWSITSGNGNASATITGSTLDPGTDGTVGNTLVLTYTVTASGTAPDCQAALSTLDVTFTACFVCEADAGSVTASAGTCTSICMAGAVDMTVSNANTPTTAADYTYTFLVSDGTNIVALNEMIGSWPTSADLTSLAAGTYTIHSFHYDTDDANLATYLTSIGGSLINSAVADLQAQLSLVDGAANTGSACGDISTGGNAASVTILEPIVYTAVASCLDAASTATTASEYYVHITGTSLSLIHI